MADNEGAHDLPQTIEDERIRDIEILVTHPVLLRYCCLLVVRVVVLVAMGTSCGRTRRGETLKCIIRERINSDDNIIPGQREIEGQVRMWRTV